MRRLPVLVWSACLLLGAGVLVLLAAAAGTRTPADEHGLAGLDGAGYAVLSVVFASVGALVARRVPGNAIGWLFLLTGMVIALGTFAFHYAVRSSFISPLPAGDLATLGPGLSQAPMFGLVALALLLFPDGRLPTARWRPVLWAAVAAVVATGGALVRERPIEGPFAAVQNPIGIPGADPVLDVLTALGFFAGVLCLALAVVAMVQRLRRAGGAERQQLRWVAFGATVTGVLVTVGVLAFIAFPDGPEVLHAIPLPLAFTAFPVTAGTAILRHRLYDIDVVVNRTLVYGGLTAALAATYLVLVVALGMLVRPLTGSSDLAVAGSTLAVAGLFGPARTRIQRAVDHRFFRRRYDTRRTLDALAADLRRETDLDRVAARVQAVVRDSVQPAHVSLWLRAPGDPR